jgi:acyl dehydratase
MTDAPFIFMEDCEIGQKFRSGPLTVTQDEIISFGRQYDPQVFHTDPVAAKDSAFGELVASGWQTAALSMRLILEALPPMKGGMIGRQIEKVSWPRPVRPGDSLSYEGEILDIRPSASNPARGVLRVKCTTTNQRGETVMEMESIIFVPRRPRG